MVRCVLATSGRDPAGPEDQADQATDPMWTIEQACQYFTESGLPIKPERLTMIIQGLEWEPSGSMPPGPKGGRGKALYPMGDVMWLHATLQDGIIRRGIRRRQR